jgi:malonyl-CoA O-methyltransferase
VKNSRQGDFPTIPIAASDGYRLWSRTYDIDPNPLLALESRILSHRLDGLAGKLVMDVGCGTGRWMLHATERLAGAVGVDSCIEMLEVAGGKPRLCGRLVQADCCTLPFRDAVADIAICSFTFGYVSDPSTALGEMARITKPGGTLFITELHPETRTRGWRRTFRVGRLLYELQAHAVDREQLLRWGYAAGLVARDICEPHMGEPEAALMQQAGRGDRFKEISAIPAILCIEWERA